MQGAGPPPPDSGPTALSLAIAVRQRTATVERLVEEALDRIATRDPSLAAFVRTFPGRALREARAMDRRLARRAPGDLPVLFGVPSGIKDTDFVAGARTQIGSRAFRYLWTPVDGAVTRRVRATGLVVLGKLQTSELALLPVTETDLHPPVRNPWSPEHTAGGSSGGSAAAVASGMLPIAHASDGGGSIRIPASFCGLFGFKPSRGLLPHFYRAVDPVGLSHVHCVARDVDDSAAMLDAMVGRAYDPREPAPRSYLARCRVPPARLRIRYADASPLSPVEPHIAGAVRATAERLAALGHDVAPAPMMDGGVDDFLPLYGHLMRGIPVLRESLLQPATRWVRSVGRRVSRAQARRAGEKAQARIATWFGDADVWLTPTSAVPPPRIGAWRRLGGEETFRAAVPIGAFTAVFNLGGHPAASVPAGVSPDGLPIGVQLAARLGDDAELLALCRQLAGTPV